MDKEKIMYWRCDCDDYNAVSYTHLDVYKRQVVSGFCLTAYLLNIKRAADVKKHMAVLSW